MQLNLKHFIKVFFDNENIIKYSCKYCLFKWLFMLNNALFNIEIKTKKKKNSLI